MQIHAQEPAPRRSPARPAPHWPWADACAPRSTRAPRQRDRPSRFEHEFSQTPLRAAGAGSGKFGGAVPDDDPGFAVTGGDSATLSPPAPSASRAAPAAPPPTPVPKLAKKTISGPTPADCGGFSWVVQWLLDTASTKGGWIVQKVELPYAVTDCANKAVDPQKVGGLQPSWYPIWEAWPVNKGQKVTTYAEAGDTADDTYGNASLAGTKGTATVKGTAEFYEGLSLPAAFKVTNKAPAWILPVTTTDPGLSGGSGSISHNLKATWDCCSKDPAASKTTKLEAV